MKHNLPMAILFGLVCAIGLIVTGIGVKQKRKADVMIGVLITTGSLLVYFIDFFDSL
jgi:hypothetical protein